MYDIEQFPVWINGNNEKIYITKEMLSLLTFLSMYGMGRGVNIFEEFLKTAENDIRCGGKGGGSIVSIRFDWSIMIPCSS